MIEGLPTELEGFAGLMPGMMYSVATRPVLERGLGYLMNGAVQELWWDEAKQMVMARVEGTEYYTTGVQAVNEKKVRHECDCPAHGRSDPCKHVVALLGALFALTQGRSFTGYQLDEGYLEELLVQFEESLGEEGPADGKPQPAVEPELLLMESPRGDMILQSHGPVPRKLLSSMGFHFPGTSPGSKGFMFHGYDMAEELPAKIKQAAKNGLPVFLPTPDKERIRLTGNCVETMGLVVLDLRSDSGEIHSTSMPISRDGRPRKPVLEMEDGTCIDHKGDVLRVEPSPANGYLDMADPDSFNWSGTYALFYRGPAKDEAMTADQFNGRSLSHPHPDIAQALPHLLLLQNSEPLDEVELEDAVEPEIVLKLKITKEGLEVDTEARVDGVVIPLEQTARNVLSDLKYGGEDTRLTNAKGRVQKLVNAALLLPTLESAKEKKALIKETVEDQAFKKLRLQKAARRWLKPFEESRALTRNAGGKKPGISLIAMPGTEKPWRGVVPPLDALMHLWLGLVRPEDAYELSQVDSAMLLTNVSPAKMIAEASVLCAAVGARLDFRGKSVESHPVEIRLEARESGDIDWFELRPEIRCGKWTIPPSEWENLIRGDLLLEKGGKVILPEVTQQQAVERLQQIFGSPQGRKPKGKGSKAAQAVERVPRLQMLDWIALRGQGVKVKLPAEAEKLFESLLNFQELAEQPLPKGLQADMRAYQRRGFDWLHFLYEHRFGACLADDMGLGKTLQAIALLAWRKETGAAKDRLPHLAVVPPTLVFNWQSEIARFYPDLETREYLGGDRDLESALKAEVIITTYDIVRRDIDALCKQRFDIVVFDETQTLKNLTAQRTKAASKLVRRFTLCLTGTPMENHVGEYYSIMNLALPGIFGEYDSFRKRLRQNQDDPLLNRARPFILRRTKAKILKELPPKVESDLHLDMSAEQKEIYTRTVGEVREEVLEAYEEKTKSQAGIVALAALTRLRQVCISPAILGKETRAPAPKMEYLNDQLQELLDEGHAVLVFSQFTRALDLLQDVLSKNELPHLRLDGKTPTKKRKTLVQTFQEHEQPHIFLISLKAGGVGLNLTRANYVYHLDPWWNPAVETQAADRAHRIGQKQTVFIQRLLMRHSIEEKMMALKNKKQELFNSIIENPQARTDSSPMITRQDFEYLLSGD